MTRNIEKGSIIYHYFLILPFKHYADTKKHKFIQTARARIELQTIHIRKRIHDRIKTLWNEVQLKTDFPTIT